MAKNKLLSNKLPNFGCPSGDSSSKIGHDFSNKVVQKLKLSINDFYKNLSLNGYSSIKKKNLKDFDIQNSLRKS